MSTNLENRDEILAEINMTPLIDIMLVLLIVFMVTSSISLESGLDIELPKTGGQVASKENNLVIISLDAKANLSVQGKKVARESLQQEIATALNREKTKEVIFEGDTAATLGRMIEIMDIAKAAGAEKFAVATDNEIAKKSSK
ncbi:MAG: biopolymer transporter ExbD [Oligoflexia bacterium]|nr:biopolymer transporter ExbD [Oligoflexia bacterium]